MRPRRSDGGRGPETFVRTVPGVAPATRAHTTPKGREERRGADGAAAHGGGSGGPGRCPRRGTKGPRGNGGRGALRNAAGAARASRPFPARHARAAGGAGGHRQPRAHTGTRTPCAGPGADAARRLQGAWVQAARPRGSGGGGPGPPLPPSLRCTPFQGFRDTPASTQQRERRQPEAVTNFLLHWRRARGQRPDETALPVTGADFRRGRRPCIKVYQQTPAMLNLWTVTSLSSRLFMSI